MTDKITDANERRTETWKLLSAIRAGDLQAVKEQLAKDINVNAIFEDWFGQSPLHVAAMYGHTEIAKYLLGVGADPALKSKGGYTPLCFARHDNHVEVVELLEPLQPEKALEARIEKLEKTVEKLVKGLESASVGFPVFRL